MPGVKTSFIFMTIVMMGCVPSTPAADPMPFALDAGGVRLLESPLRIDFGRTDHSTKSAMTKLQGTGPNGRRFCGTVTSDVWPDGTELFYDLGAFRGWRKGDAEAGKTCPRV